MNGKFPKKVILLSFCGFILISFLGLLYDREWSLIDETGAYINQKKMPHLCFLRPHIDLESGIMTVSAPDMPNLVIPLNEFPSNIMSVRVCGDK
jgi:molybdenum cofactor sulfurtransferase